YEGIDAAAALCEWNFPRQMLALRRRDEGADHVDLYRDEFLIERLILPGLRGPVGQILLLAEFDGSDPEFGAFRVDLLAAFQIPIPEGGAIRAYEPPVVILTSNRTRELHEALRRRCVYHWIEYPTPESEMRIIMMRASGVGERAARAVVAAVGRLRREPLTKLPGIARAVEWAEGATPLNQPGARVPEAVRPPRG